jgi:Putative peptidoglycan binding domain
VTVATEYYNWQVHKPAPDPRYNHCSPNLVAIYDEMGKRWGCTSLGCYGWRPIRGGTEPSSHGFGAAYDIRYFEAGRAVAISEIIPWLIENSAELHISAIHDYFGCRIWHADRQEWRAQTPNTTTGMGQKWAVYFHIETNLSGWDDNTPVPNRGDVIIPDPVPIPNPDPSTGGFVHTTVQKGSTGEAVFTVQMFLRKYAGNTDVVADGQFGSITEQGVMAIQAWYGLKADGVVGPVTWNKINAVVNS